MLTVGKIGNNRYKTPEDYWIFVDCILARVGSQTYLKNEIDISDTSEEEIELYRDAKDVFDPKSIASFENKPVTIEHPNTQVDSKNYNELAVGFVRDVRKSVVDNQEVLIGNIIITNEKAVETISNGKTELSCGYECDIVEKENGKFFQTDIRGNHVAIVEKGRAGISKLSDSDKVKEEDNMLKDSLNKIIELIRIVDNDYKDERLFTISRMLDGINNNINDKKEIEDVSHSKLHSNSYGYHEWVIKTNTDPVRKEYEFIWNEKFLHLEVKYRNGEWSLVSYKVNTLEKAIEESKKWAIKKDISNKKVYKK